MIVGSLGEQFGDIFRRMLSVAIHQDNKPPLCRTHTALHGGPVTDVVRMAYDVGAGAHGDFGAAIRGTIVDDDDFRLRQFKRLDFADQRGQIIRFVENWYDYGKLVAVRHGVDRRRGRDRENSMLGGSARTDSTSRLERVSNCASGNPPGVPRGP